VNQTVYIHTHCTSIRQPHYLAKRWKWKSQFFTKNFSNTQIVRNSQQSPAWEPPCNQQKVLRVSRSTVIWEWVPERDRCRQIHKCKQTYGCTDKQTDRTKDSYSCCNFRCSSTRQPQPIHKQCKRHWQTSSSNSTKLTYHPALFVSGIVAEGSKQKGRIVPTPCWNIFC